MVVCRLHPIPLLIPRGIEYSIPYILNGCVRTKCLDPVYLPQFLVTFRLKYVTQITCFKYGIV